MQTTPAVIHTGWQPGFLLNTSLRSCPEARTREGVRAGRTSQEHRVTHFLAL